MTYKTPWAIKHPDPIPVLPFTKVRLTSLDSGAFYRNTYSINGYDARGEFYVNRCDIEVKAGETAEAFQLRIMQWVARAENDGLILGKKHHGEIAREVEKALIKEGQNYLPMVDSKYVSEGIN
jgi:hypothetical protein